MPGTRFIGLLIRGEGIAGSWDVQCGVSWLLSHRQMEEAISPCLTNQRHAFTAQTRYSGTPRLGEFVQRPGTAKGNCPSSDHRVFVRYSRCRVIFSVNGGVLQRRVLCPRVGLVDKISSVVRGSRSTQISVGRVQKARMRTTGRANLGYPTGRLNRNRLSGTRVHGWRRIVGDSM